MNAAIQALLVHLGTNETLKTETVGAARWQAVVDGTAPATRPVVFSGHAGDAPATATHQDVPYISKQEVQEIVAVARRLGLSPDPTVVAKALAP